MTPGGADPPPTWRPAQRALHWTIAVMVPGALVLGLWMTTVPLRQMLLKYALYQAHKTVGLTVFVLALAQLALHWRVGRPKGEPGVPRWQARAAAATHAALFVALLAVPLLGYVVAATSPARIPTLFLGVINVPHLLGVDRDLYLLARRAHLVLALSLAVLVALHAAAAVAHHLAGRRTLARMWRG